jgi:hypothetical protein
MICKFLVLEQENTLPPTKLVNQKMKARETLFTNFEQNLQFYVVKDTATT